MEKLQLGLLSTGFLYVKTGSQPVENRFWVALTYTFKMYLKVLKTLKIWLSYTVADKQSLLVF